MYSLFEVAFFILYFVVKAIRFILFLLTLQIVIYKEEEQWKIIQECVQESIWMHLNQT